MTERKPHKWAEAIKAWADGKQIQFKGNGFSEWVDYDPDALRNSQASAHFFPFRVPRFDLDFDWRVKPEPVVVEKYIWLDASCNETRVSVSSSPNARFTFDPDTKELVKAEVIG